MIDDLSEQVKSLEASLDRAKHALDEASAMKLEAQEAKQKAAEDLETAERLQESASATFHRLDRALRAIRDEKTPSLAAKKRDISELLTICERALRDSEGGLEKSALEAAIRDNVNGSHRGLHKTIDRLFSAIEDDPRFLFDGHVFNLTQLDSKEPPISS